MPDLEHRLTLKVLTPTVVDEGKNFQTDYVIKNIGKNIFPVAGEIKVRISWEESRFWRIQSLVLTEDLKPGEEAKFTYFESPLTKGYTWFHVERAKASDGKPLKVFTENESALLFPIPFELINNKKNTPKMSFMQ